MKKLTNRILIISSIVLIFTIGFSYLLYGFSKPQDIGCGTEMPLDFCGTVSPELNEKGKQGKQIFNTNCASCHSLDRKMTGPSLRGILNTREHPYENYVYDVITNEDSLVKIKDKCTLAINEEYNMNFSHNFELNRTDLENLMEYLKE